MVVNKIIKSNLNELQFDQNFQTDIQPIEINSRNTEISSREDPIHSNYLHLDQHFSDHFYTRMII